MKEFKEITSLTNQHIKDLVALQNSKTRSKQERFIVEGEHLVNEAYNEGLLEEVLVTNKDKYYEGVTNILVTSDIIKKVSTTTTPQDIVGVAKIKEWEIGFEEPILLLDNVADPGNLGTIIRTALALNIGGIILSEGSVDIYNEKVVRATQGAIFKMPIIKANLIEIISCLKEHGYTVFATTLQESIDIESVKEVDKYALILGNEANGISKEVASAADKCLKINISEKMESLNVAIAGAIAIYTLNNKRK